MSLCEDYEEYVVELSDIADAALLTGDSTIVVCAYIKLCEAQRALLAIMRNR